MRFREWLRDARPPETPTEPPASGQLQHLREISRELLTAGEHAINQALSGNSEAFLAATRQEGGQ